MSEEQAGPSAVLKRVLDHFGDAVLSYHSQHGDDTVVLAPEQRLDAATWLLDDPELSFNVLMDTTVVDYIDEEPRFEIVDHFFSTSRLHRLRLKYRVDEDEPELPSLVPLYGSANWMEREAYDMYGVVFVGHPDLRRILLYPAFQGFPLRKDFEKLQQFPMFKDRYEGLRESDDLVRRRVGEDEGKWLQQVLREDPKR